MEKGQNPNAPKKGSNITVDPIRSIEDTKAIAKLLHDEPRNHLLFVLGINNGLRTGDLLKLRAKDLRYLKAGDTKWIKESKTGKRNILVVNKGVLKALRNYFAKIKPLDDDFVFKSKKGDNKPLTIQAVNLLIKKWTSAINLKGNYGAHTLRKTWGYIQRTKHQADFGMICKRFNHSSIAVTMRYLGIEDKEIHDLLMNEIC